MSCWKVTIQPILICFSSTTPHVLVCMRETGSKGMSFQSLWKTKRHTMILGSQQVYHTTSVLNSSKGCGNPWTLSQWAWVAGDSDDLSFLAQSSEKRKKLCITSFLILWFDRLGACNKTHVGLCDHSGVFSKMHKHQTVKQSSYSTGHACVA